MELRTYNKRESIVFRKTAENFGGLSNMAPGFPLEVNGRIIRTSEALYQACRFPHLPDVQQIIIDQSSPMTAKMKSKPYRLETRQDWEKVRITIMRWCLRVKLIQNWEKFGGLLLATGEKPIVEESSKDNFWGAKPAEGEMLIGANVLGRLLMELREELINNTFVPDKHIEPLCIPNFLLFGEQIDVVQLRMVNGNEALNPIPVQPYKEQLTIDSFMQDNKIDNYKTNTTEETIQETQNYSNNTIVEAYNKLTNVNLSIVLRIPHNSNKSSEFSRTAPLSSETEEKAFAASSDSDDARTFKITGKISTEMSTCILTKVLEKLGREVDINLSIIVEGKDVKCLETEYYNLLNDIKMLDEVMFNNIIFSNKEE